MCIIQRKRKYSLSREMESDRAELVACTEELKWLQSSVLDGVVLCVCLSVQWLRACR